MPPEAPAPRGNPENDPPQPRGRIDGEPQPEELTIRWKRHWFINKKSQVGIGSGVVLSVIGAFLPPMMGPALAAVPLILSFDPQAPATRRYFAYHRISRTITAVNNWGRWTQYPRRPGSRLALREHTGELFELRPDGEKKPLPIKRKLANPDDWNAFTARFRRDHPHGLRSPDPFREGA